MSQVRPELHSTDKPATADRFDTFWMVRDSVERQAGLIRGQLHDLHGYHCAVGAFFNDHPDAVLATAVIDEIARYNDSLPKTITRLQRRNRVLRWLTAKIDTMRGRIVRRKRTVSKTKAA